MHILIKDTKMLDLNLPKPEAKIIHKNNTIYIWDIIRKKYIVLTPEEWVRQHFVHYLINSLHYPLGLLANEVEISLNKQKKRCDTVVYDKEGLAKMIIEYKSPNVTICQETFDQISRYNIVLKVDYLIVSNGINHFCCKVDYSNNQIFYLESIPEYEAL